MANLDTTSQLTLLELAKRKDPKGNLAAIAEVLTETNEILLDAVWSEANDTFSHQVVRRAALPGGAWRQLNAGVALESSQTIKVVEDIGMLEAYSRADIDLVDASPNPRQFRNDEAQAFLEGMSQTLADTLIYGNSGTDPEQFTGLAPRLNTINSQNVWNASGGGGDTSSVFIVQWGLNRVHMVYPKGSSVGLEHMDDGIVTVAESASSTNPYKVYQDHFRLKAGLAVKDTRCIARVANIESTGAANIFDEDLLIKLLNKMPMAGAGATIYVNDTIKSQMEIKLKDKTNVNFTTREGLGGVEVLTFRGRPVRMVDAITNAETAVS